MADFPGGCKNVQQYGYFVLRKVTECINEHMSKEETASYLQDQFQIDSSMTNKVLENIKPSNPAFNRSYDAENNQRIRGDAPNVTTHAQTAEKTRSSLPPQADSVMARRRAIPSGVIDTTAREQEQQRLSPPTACRSLETAQNLQRYAAPSTQVPQEAATANAANPLIFVEPISTKAAPSNALKKQKLRVSQQSVYSKTKLRQKQLNALGQIHRSMDQMVKLLTDGHGFGPHHSAAGSSIRQRVEQEKERGDNEEAEELQEIERDDNEEAEKLQEKERGDNEEAEKLQEKERGDNEEAEKLQEIERGNNEEAEKLQEKERGGNEDAEKLQDTVSTILTLGYSFDY